MHVVILAEFAAASGGAEKVAVESARGLAEAGARVSFIQAVDGPVDPLLDHPGVQRIALGLPDVWSLPAWRGAVSGIWNGEAARRLTVALAALPEPVDCLHLHQWSRAFSPAVLPVLLAQSAPLVLTLHDYFMACPNGVYYRFDRDEPCALRPMSAACLAAPCDPKSRLHKAVRVGRAGALRIAAGAEPLDVIHVCDASRGRMAEMLAGRPLRHYRIDNPVRVAHDTPAEPERGDAVAYVGRLTAEKGADLVAEAARRAGLPALFIGAGPLEDFLRAQGAEIIGWRSPAEVAAILRVRARAVCAPSRWYETGPLTIYEALAQGIPAIASNRSGAAEKVRHGETGLVVEPEAGALAEVFRVLKDDAVVARFGRAAHAAYWQAPPTLGAHARALLELYRRLVDETSERRSGRNGNLNEGTAVAAMQ
ncbi:glycosyl transferase family 1 [Methylobacterium sp. Leaf456]|uniref:glycosyltransferase n=1 Tax=Methylobacterium sp. Leaf456 TaxID=1736382 RepID=UPI0006F8C836|nr:glycosyltransferase [Methylobacterium sp. Leaf456]KQT53444.1 glycosyl transferase family 1 [Methylobacterium sp. Leaf456]